MAIVAALNQRGDKVGKELWRLAGFDDVTGAIVPDCETADLSGRDAGIGVVFTTDSSVEN